MFQVSYFIFNMYDTIILKKKSKNKLLYNKKKWSITFLLKLETIHCTRI